MPYGTRKKGSKYQVYNKRSGKVYGSHSSKEKANKQLAALHIHTNEGVLPRMTEVFRVNEGPPMNRPPPGSQPVKATDWTALGKTGDNLKKGLDALRTAGQESKPYRTPQGDIQAYPNDSAPGRGPMKADMSRGGLWQPVTGSSATGAPTSPLGSSTTMK